MNIRKQDCIERLRSALTEVAARRLATRDDRNALVAVKRFQSARMAHSHADLLAQSDTRAAALFFLQDLYGEQDQSRRDADLARVIPLMQRMLTVPALAVISQAIELDALSEMLDAQMAEALGSVFDEDAYQAAYRSATSRADRVRQIALVAEVGEALCDLVRVPLIGTTLKMMGQPAKVAGLGELHDFLLRGYTAFKTMRQPRDFVSCIVERETALMQMLSC